MKRILATSLSILMLVGCNTIIIVHEEGDLPKLDIDTGKEFCDKQFRAKVKEDELIITCSIKL